MLESFHSKRIDLIGSLKDLLRLADRVGAKSLGGRIGSDLVEKLEADRFNLVVVGEFNHGKTTFVNALLGGNVLPVGVTPTTAVIHHLEYAEAPRAEVVYESGEKKPLPFDQVKLFAVGGAEAPHHSVGAVQGMPNAAGHEVKHLEVGYPADLLRERVALVDTP